MPVFSARLNDIEFVLHEVFNAEAQFKNLGFQNSDESTMDMILGETAKIAEKELFPLYGVGDREGCKHDKTTKEVTTPTGFKQAYNAFKNAGLMGLAADENYGGMGLPQTMNTATLDILNAANMPFYIYFGLTQGAAHAIDLHGSEELKGKYLPKMNSGEWAGTMNLTEPQAGTDLGLIRTKAEEHPDKDGSYAITGDKIFISGGEHDLTDNIVHLVLAKLPDAPAGTKGISMFIVPKFLPKEENGDVVPGDRNAVECTGIEEKMGLHASATCSMHYEGAKGWLVGEPHKGMKYMFSMMNAARLGVGMQGLGIAENAYQNAVEYANMRMQSRAASGPKTPGQPADYIIEHANVRDKLMQGKAFTEGGRALSYWVGMNQDIAHHHPDKEEREKAEDIIALMTPVIKAYQTDMGVEIARGAIDVYGGHGYITENGVEQLTRDAHIARQYEGTNDIQALDLLGRKVLMSGGKTAEPFLNEIKDFIAGHAGNQDMDEFTGPLKESLEQLETITFHIAATAAEEPDEAVGAANDYLRMAANVAMAYMWAEMADVAQQNLKSGAGKQSNDFYEAKINTAYYFYDKMLPENVSLEKRIRNGVESTMAVRPDQFVL